MSELAPRDVSFATIADVMNKKMVFIDGKEIVSNAIRLTREKSPAWS